MTPHRADSIDVLRGMAMLWMTVFHFCFDLSHFGLWPQDFRADPWWTQQRTAIVSLFLLCAGCGQAMALDAGWGWARFARRWGYIVAAAALVTLGSWWMFPQSFIYFGVLHGMAVMLVLVRLRRGECGHHPPANQTAQLQKPGAIGPPLHPTQPFCNTYAKLVNSD